MKTGGWRYCLAEPACLASAPVINILVDCSQWQSLYFRQRGNLGAFAVLPKGFIGPFSGRPILSGWVIGC